MKPIDPTVRRETGYIALWVVIFSTLMQAVFLLLRQWSLPVLFGGLLGGGAAVGNFFLMGLSVQSAVGQDEKQATALMRASLAGRMLLLFLAILLILFVVNRISAKQEEA